MLLNIFAGICIAIMAAVSIFTFFYFRESEEKTDAKALQASLDKDTFPNEKQTGRKKNKGRKKVSGRKM